MKILLKTLALSLISVGSIFSASAQSSTDTRLAELATGDRRDITVPNVFSPYGNSTELDRFGDDGSAAIVDASGSIIWRTSQGVYRPLPNTQVSKPLFVSNTECIVWRNAFESDATKRTEIQITYFRLDSQYGNIRESDVKVLGNIVLNTPVVTASTSPYVLVTGYVNSLPPTQTPEAVMHVYRLTYDAAAPQLLSRYTRGSVSGNLTPEAIEVVSSSGDGSYVVLLTDDYLEAADVGGGTDGTTTTDRGLQANGTEHRMIWIRPDGAIRNCANNEDIVSYFDRPDIVPIKLSATEFIYHQHHTEEVFRDISFFTGVNGTLIQVDVRQAYVGTVEYNKVHHLVRGTTYDTVTERDPIPLETDRDYISTASPPFLTANEEAAIGRVSDERVLALENSTEKGSVPLFVTRDETSNLLRVYRLKGNLAELVTESDLPEELASDNSIFRLNVTAGSESVALLDRNNGGIVWLHEGLGSDEFGTTTNYSIIETPGGRPLFVTPFEMVVWTNAYSGVMPNGSLPAIEVVHYSRNPDTGVVTENKVKVLADATDPTSIFPGDLRGGQVFSPPQRTPDPDLWRLETGEKIGGNTLRVRRYQMINPDVADTDGDGIRDGMERGPFYVIPGTFTYAEALIDAEKRGGKLASITDAADFALFQKALALQARNSPMPLPKLVLPYPLWMGINVVGQVGVWDDGTPNTLLADNANWVGGTGPSITTGKGRFTSTQKWESVAATQRSGYLLELTPTNPDDADTDADGGNDFDELFALLTDPQVGNFAATGSTGAVDFGSYDVLGRYEGFLTHVKDGPLYSLTVQVSKAAGMTARINGMSGAVSLRGTFGTDGTLTLPVNSSGLVGTLAMTLAQDVDSGFYRINGSFEGYSGSLVFELRRAIYSVVSPAPSAGTYTIILPAASSPKLGQPSGDGYLTGTIAANGTVSLRGASSQGDSLAWSGKVLEGGLMSFYSKLGRSFGAVSSNLFIRNAARADVIYGLKSKSDLDGNLIITRGSPPGAAYMPGYRFRSEAYGSRLFPVSYGQLLASNFEAQPNNALLRFSDGPYSGQNVVATWSTNNKVAFPTTQTRTMNASFNARTGEFKGTYKYNEYVEVIGELPVPPTTKVPDPDAPPVEPVIGVIFSGYTSSASRMGGVVLQKSNEVRGFYTGNTAPGRIELVPNADGTPAPVTQVSPKSRFVSPAGETYRVYLTTSEAWAAILAADATIIVNDKFVPWVKVTKADGSDPKGYSSAELIVTVSPNNAFVPRTTSITIAGVVHTIQQDAYTPVLTR